MNTDKQVTVALAHGYTVHIETGRHKLIADEPAAIGGADLGPDPYAYILAGLGACTAITLRMYADRKKWPLTSVEVKLSHHRSHAADCADCEGQDVRIDEIRKELVFSGNLTEEQISRLKQISDKCPVQKTLAAGVRITSEFKEMESA